MERRRALATIASVAFGAVAIAAAVGATTRVFNVAEASPGVGRVSPVATPAPVVEHRIIDVEDPAPVPASAPAPLPTTTSRAAHAPSTPPTRTDTSTGTAPPTASTVAPTTVPHHETEPSGEDD